MINVEFSEKKQIKKKLIIELTISAFCFIILFAIYLFESSILTLVFIFIKFVVLLVGTYCFVNSIFDSKKLYRRTEL